MKILNLKKAKRLMALCLIVSILFSVFNIKVAEGKQITVVIQPGHSVGFEPGTTSSPYSTEAELNERLAIALMKELDTRGYKVYMTHCSDPEYANRTLSDCETCCSLRNTGPIVNAIKPDLAINIHHNSTAEVPSTVSGMELYWSSYRDFDTEGVYTDPTLWNGEGGYKDKTPCKYAQESLRFAKIIYNIFQGMPNMAAPRSINERDDYLPAHAEAPCVLYEGGYMSTPTEAQYLNSNEYRDEAATRLAQSVDLFFGNSRPAPGVNVTPKQVNMVSGTKAQLKTINIPNNNTNDTYTYLSEDPTIAAVDESGLVSGIKEGQTQITVRPNNNPSVEQIVGVSVYPAADALIDYEVYTDEGWQKAADGFLAGSTDVGFPVYGIRASLRDSEGNPIDPDKLNLFYKTHIANVGWEKEVTAGNISGAEDTENPVEAVEFSLGGSDAANYQLYYRTHIKEYDWTSFVTGSQNCGSEGYANPVSGLELMIIPADAVTVPPTGGEGFYSLYGNGDLRYAAHVSNIGWLDFTHDGTEAAALGSGQNVEAIEFNLSDALPEGKIVSETHISNIGWVNSENNIIGTVGQAQSIEALKLSLSGDLGNQYDINYQVFVKGQGWTAPAKSGIIAGTIGQALPVESVKIWLTRK